SPQAYTLSLHDALPISSGLSFAYMGRWSRRGGARRLARRSDKTRLEEICDEEGDRDGRGAAARVRGRQGLDRGDQGKNQVARHRSEEHTSELQSPDHLV